MGNGVVPGQWQGPSPGIGQPGLLLHGRRRRIGGRRGLPSVPHPPARRPQQGRRLHPQDLRRPGRGARAARARRDQDRPARPQDRQAPRRDPARPGGRVPPHRQRLGRRRLDPDRLRPVRRHRRHHAGDPQPADPGGQRDQHAGRRQHGRVQRASLRREDRGRGRAPVQQGDPRGDRDREPAHDHRPAHARVGRRPVRPQGRAAPGRHRRPGRRAGRPGQQEAGDRRRTGQSAGRRRRDRLPRKRRPIDRRRGRLRQQPALHRREAGLCRRPDLRLAHGGDDPARRVPPQRRPGRCPDAGRLPEGERRGAARQQRPDRPGPGGAGPVRRGPGSRGNPAPLRRDRRRAPVRPPRADDAVRPVRSRLQRRPRDRAGQGERARLRPHGHPPLARHLGDVADGQDHGLHDLRGQRPVHGRAGHGRRGGAVVLDRRADRRRRHHAADLLPPAPHQRRRAACGSFER